MLRKVLLPTFMLVLLVANLSYAAGGSGLTASRASANSSANLLEQSAPRTFPETGYTVSGSFLSYWETHGGRAQQSFPISDELQERSDTNGKTYTMQYFERSVFELHPENQAPNDVLLSLLGVFRYNATYPSGAPNQLSNDTPGSVLFSETGKRLGGVFLEYWQEHGGLAQQGYPISDEFQEVSALDGNAYRVQYFERAVFELHPENAGTPYEVLLSQLGTFRYRTRYTSVTPTPTPYVVAGTISPVALAYLQEALDWIEQTSIAGDKVDWQSLRRETIDYAKALNAQTTADTYPTIRSALQRTGDRHAALYTPEEASQEQQLPYMGLLSTVEDGEAWQVQEVLTNSLAEKAGMLPGDTITQINSKRTEGMDASVFFSELYGQQNTALLISRVGASDPISVTLNHEPVLDWLIPHGRRLPGNIGYVALPPNHFGTVTPLNLIEEYASITQQVIKAVDEAEAASICGWIVDLQRNTGGNSHVIILGVGPILGEGEAGVFIRRDGTRIPWAYQNGSFLYGGYPSKSSRPVTNPYQLKQPMPPVAVLTSRTTASAGEHTLVSFRGRPASRSFGEPTYGLPTGPLDKIMSDGAIIAVGAALEADRTGHVYAYNERIAPDQFVATEQDIARIGTDDDKVVQAALQWLREQASCRR